MASTKDYKDLKNYILNISNKLDIKLDLEEYVENYIDCY